MKSEQENFLSAYRFLISVIARIKSLSDIADDIEESRQKLQFEDGFRYKKLMDFIKLNFGSIEWEMEGFKRKIMVNLPQECEEPVYSVLPFSRRASKQNVTKLQ